MSRDQPQGLPHRHLQTAAYVVIVVAGLRAAASTLTPILMALLFAILCLGPMRWMQRRGLPDALAVGLTFLGALVALFGVSILVGDSIGEFNEAAALYHAKLEQLLLDAETWLDEAGLLSAFGFEVGHLSGALDTGSLLNLVRHMLGGLLSVLSSAFLVSFLLAFMLFEATNFPLKLRRAFGGSSEDLADYRKVVQSVNDYMVVKTIVSALTGLLVALMMYLLGVEFALLWGLIAFAFNYIPNIGSILAAIPGIVLALVEAGPSTAGLAAGGYALINLGVGNVLEPRLLGNRLGLSPLVVFVSLIVWSYIFGPVGMLLSAPLTAIFKIVLEHTRDYRAIAVLLGPTEPETPEPPSGAGTAAPPGG